MKHFIKVSPAFKSVLLLLFVLLSGCGGSPYGGTPAAIPGLLETERYDLNGAGKAYSDTTPGNAGGVFREDDVDIGGNGEGGFNLGWIESGEWAAYTVNVAEAGSYTVTARVASLNNAIAFHLEKGGQSISQPFTHNSTGGWTNWQTVKVSGVALKQGTQQIRLVFESAGFNIDWLKFEKDASEPPTGNTPVAVHGRLSVNGNQIVDQHGKVTQLRGMSSHGLHWYGQYMNRDSIQWLRDDWNIDVIRAAMYTAEGGYIANPSIKDKVIEVIDVAIELGLYVVVDWHILYDNNPNTYKTEAKDFFADIARRYGNVPNIIYEIANEPNGASVTWQSEIKPYAEEVIPVIRAIDPDNLILVGTGTWSQDIHHAADSPLSFSNVAYVLHFYAGTHGSYLRDRVDYARSRNIAIFVSEWGTTLASGDGGVYGNETRTWINFLNQRNISWINWNISDKNESSAILRPGAGTQGHWQASDLTESGNLVKSLMF